MADRVIAGRSIVEGAAEGEALVTTEALSFWGGYDFHTGEIIDKHHPLAGVRAAGRILVVPFSKGSSTTTAVLLESTPVVNIAAGAVPARTASRSTAVVVDEPLLKGTTRMRPAARTPASG